MKETAVELPTDPRLVEISVKVAEVGKVSFTLETKKKMSPKHLRERLKLVSDVSKKN